MRDRVLRAVRDRGLWPSFLIFVALANLDQPVAAYLALAAYSAVELAGAGGGRGPSARGLLLSLLAFTLVHAPLAAAGARSSPSPQLLLLSAISAVVEEAYFRGALLRRVGALPQALPFALAHVRLTDPVSLVESALLVPHYAALGVALGLVAEEDGYLTSAAAHSAYNVVSLTYTVNLSVGDVSLLLALDGLLLAATLAYARVIKRRRGGAV